MTPRPASSSRGCTTRASAGPTSNAPPARTNACARRATRAVSGSHAVLPRPPRIPAGSALARGPAGCRCLAQQDSPRAAGSPSRSKRHARACRRGAAERASTRAPLSHGTAGTAHARLRSALGRSRARGRTRRLPGTSKWNKIEHRLFSFITKNWRSKPLVHPSGHREPDRRHDDEDRPRRP